MIKPTRSRAILMSGAALLTFVSGAAFAQDADGKADEEIVITAQKRAERLQDVPISITALTGEALDKQPVGGVTDALRAVPGLNITSTPLGGATQITIRGVSANGEAFNGASTVAYYIDSVPFGLVKSAIVPDTNAYDLERIEVLRGPQGTLYGANALNGVVRILTHDADLSKIDFKGRVGVSTTEDGSQGYRGDLAFNLPLVQDKLALRLVAGYENAPGWIDQPVAGNKDVNETRSHYVRAKLNARPTENLDIALSAWISRIDQDAPSYSEDNREQATAPFKLPQSLDFDAYNGKITYRFPGFSIESATSYLKFFNNSKRDYTFILPDLTLDTIFRSKVFTEEILFRSDNAAPIRWSVGAFYRNAKDLLHQDLAVFLPAPINYGDNSKSYAVFGEATYVTLDDRLELTGGLRYFNDKVSQIELTPLSGNPADPLINVSKTFNKVSPRAVVTFHPNRQMTFYASYSQGFRSGFNQEPGVIRSVLTIPPAGADSLTNYEVGSKGKLMNGMLSYEAALFYIKWKDIQQNANVIVDGVLAAATVNGESASGPGLDLSLIAHPITGLDIGGTFSWNNLTLDGPTITQTATGPLVVFPEGSRVGFSPKYNATAFMSYRFPVGAGGYDAELSGGLTYSSKIIARNIVNDQSVLVESDAPFTARARVSIISPKHWRLSLYGENLTDWNGVVQPPADPARKFRLRPRTFGLEFAYSM